MFDWDNPDQPEPAIKFPVFLWTPDGRLQEAVHGPFGPMAPLEENAAAARARLHDYVAVATVEFPVFSKLFDAERVDTPVALEKAIWTILRTTHTGNLAFSAVLEADAGLVWHYRPIVEEAMNSNYVPMFSIARTAAEEKLTETIGAMRLSTKLAMTSGLAALGATGIAALAGAGAAAPPLVVAVLVVDGAINLYDLYEEYREYRRQSAAFHATLDPTLALASEPSVVMFAVNAGLTVISIIPGAGSGKAAPKALSAVP